MARLLPYLREATDAASKIVLLQRDLAVLNAELAAARQAKRMAYGAAALVCLNLALTLGVFWASWELHESGWPAMRIAAVTFVFFGLLAVFAMIAAKTTGRSK